MMKLFFLKTAFLLGQESKCVSKQVGAVIVKDKRIISTGYNGTPSGFENCNQHFPEYDPTKDRDEHHEWSKTYEIHAEENAINFAAAEGQAIAGAEIYTILQPCDECLKSIIAAKIKKIYYVIPYDKSSKNNKLWDRIEYERVEDKELMDWLSLQYSWYEKELKRYEIKFSG
jgi:dCMP deaminase